MKNWFKENWFKLGILLVLISTCVIAGLYFLSVIPQAQFNENARLVRASFEKLSQDKKEYLAARKKDCLQIFEVENKKWNNVEGWHFSLSNESCNIRYRDPKPKTKAQCKESFPVGGESGFDNLSENLLCLDGQFEKVF